MRSTTGSPSRCLSAHVATMLTLGAALLIPATASAVPTLSGTMHDPKGEPLATPLMVSLHPDDPRVGQTLPVVGRGASDAHGRYTVTITDTATVAKFAAKQSGIVELWVDSSNGSGGESDTFVRRVDGEGDAMQLIDPNPPKPRVTGSDADGTVRGGPLTSYATYQVGLPMRTGARQLVGTVGFANTGRKTATLESIRPLDLRPELAIVKVRVAGEHRRSDDAGGQTDWPNPAIYPSGTLRPVAGFKVTPDRHRTGQRGTNVAFVVRSTTEGAFGWSYVEVRYRIGAVRYRRILPTGFTGCFSKRGTMGCPALPALPTLEQTIARYELP